MKQIYNWILILRSRCYSRYCNNSSTTKLHKSNKLIMYFFCRMCTLCCLLSIESAFQTYWWMATGEVSNLRLKHQTWNYPVQYSKYKKKTRWPPLLLYDRERKQDGHHCYCMTEKENRMATIAIVWQRKKTRWPPLLMYDRERN